jgi:S-adenosylmethionine decarboxylase proenzyme
MFQDSLSAGKHMICDLKNIQNKDLLNSYEKLNEMLELICDFYQFQIIEKIHKNFTPEGCTILYLLSESHLSIHTFPERSFLSFDIYTCRNYEDNKEYLEIFDCLLDYLNADKETSNYTIIDRKF